MKLITHFLLLLLALGSCTNNPISQSGTPEQIQEKHERKTCNAVYYWKTVFVLPDSEQKFLKDNNIGRLYIRYFDVYMDPESYGSPAPDATIRFTDSIPQNIEIIPTIFIDNELFKICDMSHYPQRLVERIMTMSETNDISNINEIQLDCDWTQTTETSYFNFLEEVRKLLMKKNMTLSVTIRLHQLQMKVPPADRGVLMCYNTGAVRSSETGNSILSAKDVTPYAKHLKNYQLPLDIAYPTFSWAVWFSDDYFQALLRSADPANPDLKHKKENVYAVKNGFYQEGHYLAVDDEIRFEFSDYDEIIKTKQLLEHQLTDYSIILYHLDSANLSKYTNDEINKLFSN